MPSSLLSEAITHATETEGFLEGEGVLSRIPEALKEKFPGRSFILVGASDTWAAAGAEIEASLVRDGLRCEKSLVLPVGRGIHAEYGLVGRIRDILAGSEAVPVAVGSGTINDLVKRAAYEAERRYVCVATAASVDGYTSSGAAILKDGFKQTLPCPAPRLIVADSRILCAAPAYLTSSGYGDLASKLVAGADWFVADAVKADPLEPVAFRLAQGELRLRLADPAKGRAGDPGAIMALFEGLAMTGFSMQYMKSSRPVSGCEHLFSHIWEMEDLSFGGAPVTHGHKVALGTLIATAIYETVLARGLDDVDPSAAATKIPSPRERERAIRERFEGSPAASGAVVAAVAVSLSKLDPRISQSRVEGALGQWQTLSKRLAGQLLPYAELQAAFSAAGCPVRAEDIGLSRDYAIRTAFRAQMIRDRYSILDLLFDAGILDEVIEAVIAQPRYL